MITAGEYKNSLFFFVCIANITIGTFQEVRSKLTIDKLSVITQSHVRVIRDGHEKSVNQEEIVLGDTVVLALGNQICADGVVIASNYLEIDESLITGESHTIKKQLGDPVFSGSYVVSGSGAVKITAVGKSSYANQLTAQAKYEKKSNSQLMRTINFIIRSLTIVLVPLGLGLFLRTYLVSFDYSTSVLAMTAACVGMIPAGLVLLTSVALAVGAFNLVRHKTLTQSMPSIEMLARVDVLCLDKTGTITDGRLSVHEIVPIDRDITDVEIAMAELSGALPNDDKTMQALLAKFSATNNWHVEKTLPFSSSRKMSACMFKEFGTFVMGAPEFVLPTMDSSLKETISSYTSRGFRVMLIAIEKQNGLETSRKNRFDLLQTGNSVEISQYLSPFALIVLADHLRDSAPATFQFFKEQEVEIKVISGDDPQTVSTVAQMAGIPNAEAYIDMSKFSSVKGYTELLNNYTVFGRTTPDQKREMVQSLKASGRVVGMTGDGVNDAMALRVADVGIAMASGSEATRAAADFVLVDSDFSSMIEVVREGRRVVNNIEGVASLYLTKTIYSVMLTLLFMALSFRFPFQPIQMTLLGFFMIGAPSLFLTFEPNYQPMHDRFIHYLIKDAVPAAMLVVLNMVVIQVIGLITPLSTAELSTLSLLLNGVVCMFLLIRVCRPFTRIKQALVVVLVGGFFCGFLFFSSFFELTSIFNSLALIWIPLVVLVYPLYQLFTRFVLSIESHWLARKA
jgi:cation-transporting ATPase E